RSPIHFSNSRSRSRGAFFCARVLLLASRNPVKGWRSAESRPVLARHRLGLHMTRQARRLARRLASHDAGRPPLGAHTVAILGSGPALPSPAFAPDLLQRAPRARVVVRMAGSRASRDDGSKPPARDATPRSAFRMPPDDALQ